MKYYLLAIILILLVPDLTQAQTLGLTESLCEGEECSACHFVELANRLIKWLIGIVVILFAVLAVWAGFGLVTSGGNPSALQDAKSRFTNAFIGLLIVLSAWLLVDTLMRGIVNGADGEIAGYGPWSEVQCATQSESTTESGTLDIEIEAISNFATNPQTCSVNDGSCTTLIENCGGADNAILDDSDGLTNATVSCLQPTGLDVGADGTCSTPASDLVSVNLMGGSVQVHQQYAANVEAINAEWQNRGGSTYYKVNQIGGYAARAISGSSRCSYHSQGAAIDINWNANPHCPSWAPCGGQNILITDMDEQSPAFYTTFTSNGWKWGGRWNSSKDAMHFSPSGG